MIVGNPISTGVGDAIYVLTIITAPGANVSAVLGDQTIATTANGSGVAVLRFKKEGTWTVTATDGVNTKTTTIEVTARKAETITFFPADPTEYSLIKTYTASNTWTAPEDGHFQVEVYGASGKGGGTYVKSVTCCGGGGGGGGGYSCSRVKMKAGDTVTFITGAVGAVSSATINSSLESYSVLTVTSGATGGTPTSNTAGGAGGSGGIASGGNYSNINGGTGGTGENDYILGTGQTVAGGAGGSAGYTGGNAGGKGESLMGNYDAVPTPQGDAGAGKVGFVKIYRGNTNVTDSGGTPTSYVLYEAGMTQITGNANNWQSENAEFYSSNADILNGPEPVECDPVNGIVIDAAALQHTKTQWVALALHDNVDLTGPLTTYSTLNFNIQNLSAYLGPAVYLTDDMTKWSSGTKLATIENSTILSIPTADIQAVKYILIVGYWIDDNKAYISKIWFE